MPAIQVAVCGPADCDETTAGRAREVGELLARAGATVLCGGGAGVMAALSELALARRRGGIPVVSLGGWTVRDATGAPVVAAIEVDSPRAAVATALARRRPLPVSRDERGFRM